MSQLDSDQNIQPEEPSEVSEHSDGLNRRTVLKTGALIGAAAVLTSQKSLAQSRPAPTPPPVGPVVCAAPPVPSPPTRPFIDNLPIPSAATPVFLHPAPTRAANIAGGEAARADHQRWTEFFPIVRYSLTAAPSLHTFHTDLLPSYLWTFNGKYPSSTILNYYGVSSLVRFRNQLPEPDVNTSTGVNEISIHLHNGHTPSESDGFAADFFTTGFFKDNHYPNVYAGVDQFGGIGDPREAMHTFWFHDHRAEFTANNNYLGLNGMYFVYDAKDPGHELPTPGSLRLPGYYGITDIPLVLSDKRFCPAANGRNEIFAVPGAAPPGAGDKWLVNGKIQPKLKVRRRKYRFRILATGPVKTWNLSLIAPDGTQAPITVVAVDANFVESPFVLTNRPLTVEVAMRYDVIIDFAAFTADTSVYLRENTVQNVGVVTADPAPGLAIGNVMMRFDVVEREFFFPPDTPAIPAVLTTMPDPIVPDTTFEWRFTLVGGRFLVNGMEFDHNRVDHVVLKGSSEEWTLANDVAAGNWNHPVHIHFEEGRIISRRVRVSQNPDVFQDLVLQPEEQGRRDVYPLPPQHRVVMRQRFRDFVGRYLIHCHNMNHEDGFMMVRWDIVDSQEELVRRRLEIDERRRLAGLAPQYTKDGGLA